LEREKKTFEVNKTMMMNIYECSESGPTAAVISVITFVAERENYLVNMGIYAQREQGDRGFCK
jgi:hypothetical protein